MHLNKLGLALLLLTCAPWANVNDSRAADVVPTGASTETCADPGSYEDWATRLPGTTVAKGSSASPLLPGEPMPALTYKVDDVKYDLADFLKRTKVAGFIVLHQGKVVKEIYCDGYALDHRFNFQSVTKSVISTLVAIMLKDHPEFSVETEAGAIAKTLSGSAYAKVPLRSILQMSSGAEFDDAKHMSGWRGFFKDLLDGASLEEKVRSQKSIRKHGTKFQYSGIDTSALEMVLAAATKTPNDVYLTEKLWQPLRMEASAEWKSDRTQQRTSLAFCCLYATLRDIARFGRLMAQDGIWDGKRILPEGWVHKATHPDAKHVMPDATGWLGYQYQWWTETENYMPDSFYGMGIHGQNLYIDPQAGLVVVVASQWPKAEVPEYYSHTRKFMRAISRYYRGQ